MSVLNVDKYYAANLESLRPVENSPNYAFRPADICDTTAIDEAFRTFAPDAVIHLGAESHFDRSIDGLGAFIRTNIDDS